MLITGLTQDKNHQEILPRYKVLTSKHVLPSEVEEQEKWREGGREGTEIEESKKERQRQGATAEKLRKKEKKSKRKVKRKRGMRK